MKESHLQSKCIKILRDKGHYVVNVHGGGWGNKGCPDLIACINGKFYAFELKVGDNEPSTEQKIHLKRVLTSGGKSYIIRSVEQLKEILRRE